MSDRAALGHADNRPRIHIWPHPTGAAWSAGPTGTRISAIDRGRALNHALDYLKVRAGAVVIIEPHP